MIKKIPAFAGMTDNHWKTSPLLRQSLVEVGGADLGELVLLAVKEVVGAGNHLVFDDNALLGLQL